MTTNPIHSPLDLPLGGVRRIEASAGTGKTFTLALLHTRLLIEHGLSVRQILAVTFTKAATQELRERLRAQLNRAAMLAALPRGKLDGAMLDGDAAERITAAVIDRRLAHETAESLVARLHRAAGEIDLAAIFTIHGFCQRVLADHAVASGEPLLPRDMLESERELVVEVSLDVWRRWTRQREDADDLLSLWSTPVELSHALPALLRADELRPHEAPVDRRIATALAEASRALRDCWKRDGADTRAIIADACVRKVFHGNKLRIATLDKLWTALDEFTGDADSEAPDIDKLGYITPDGLRDRANAGREGQVPSSPVFDAIAVFLATQARAFTMRAQAHANLLHAVCAYARQRLAELKRAHNLLGFDDLIDGVHAALRGPAGDAFAHDLRTQYPAALVDEFQDTDSRQWDIFRTLYGNASGEHTDAEPVTTLFVIGDPKQAIYRFRGGDVHAYHAAGRHAHSDHSLASNFRSRPRVIDAVATLFARGGEFPFADDTTRYPRVSAGGLVADADFVRGASPAPGLHLWRLPLRDGETTRPTAAKPDPQIKVDAARRLGAAASAAQIALLLSDPDARLVEAGALRRIASRDIAVLVNTHREAEFVQAALAMRGVPSVTAGRSSLFATREAGELLRVLEALHTPSDERRMRAALATELIGVDAVGIDALSRDEAALRTWLDQFERWRERWERLGPLPMLADRVAAAAPRMLGYLDGERRLSNYLQLAEQLQEERNHTVSSAGLVDWLERRISQADDRDETQQLRLESDAQRVQVMTLHKAKGLEFACVFLPFAAMSPYDASSKGLGLLDYHDDGRRIVHARIQGLDDDAYSRGRMIAALETRAEQLRLLYVGLTRAKVGLWLAHGAINGVEQSALGWLLHRNDGDRAVAIGDAPVAAALDALAAALPEAIENAALPDLAARMADVDDAIGGAPPLRIARRDLRQDWWVHSFSQLARQDGGIADTGDGERGAADEMASGVPVFVGSSSPFTGARFGNALHAALETVEFAAWLGASGDTPPGQGLILRNALGQVGYSGDDALLEGGRILASMIGSTLNVRLPEGLKLAELPRSERRDELEFHLAMRDVPIGALFDLLHRHGLLRGRSGFGSRDRLEGLLTGFIDLVYRHEGRVYLVDYKSNQLADYASAALAEAMSAREYDLQYVIYTLALHRWLRFRHADYDYDRDFGGVRYLFCRGLDRASESSPGIYATRPSRELIDQLDALFAPPDGNAA